MRVHDVYNCFPNPFDQINHAYNVSANKLLKVGNNEVFKNFVKEIKNEVNEKYDDYNGNICEKDFLTLITKKILKKSENHNYWSFSGNLEIFNVSRVIFT